MRTPTIPKELYDRNHDRDGNARNGTEYRHTGKTGHGKPEFPALDPVDPAQIRYLDQADCRCNNNGGKGGMWQIPQQLRSKNQQKRDGKRADDSGELGPSTCRLSHWRSRRTAADREALKER